MKLYIYPIEGNPKTGATQRGPLLATVTEGGKAEPDDAGIEHHVECVMAEGLRGKALRDRLERSYSNGYFVAEWR